MADISRITTWVYEKLTHEDLNNEFDNVVDGVNAVDARIPTITSFAETILDDTSAASVRTTIGTAYGTSATTVCVGNDSRLSDTRTPTASSVDQGTLDVSLGEANTTDVNGEAITITGGLFAFMPQIKASSGNTVYWGKDSAGASTGAAAWSTSTSFATLINLSTSAGTGYAQWNYITASPPYDLGDGDVYGFLYLKLDSNNKVVSVHMAEDPPWYGNVPKTEDKLNGMDLHPQPFANISEGQKVVLVDPMSDKVKELFELKKTGVMIGDLFYSGEIKVGDKVERCTPPGVDAYEIK